ncbi:Dna-Directed Rna polymerase Ii Subunit Rpb1 [Manis pentadactyla]|nr:Dna-Directed Rna polymerase Ii Subunit Rpb1 [Manis pentadactyla]
MGMLTEAAEAVEGPRPAQATGQREERRVGSRNQLQPSYTPQTPPWPEVPTEEPLSPRGPERGPTAMSWLP